MLACLNLFDIGVHGAVQVAGVFHDLTTQGFAALLDLAQTCIGFAYLRTGQATAVDRNVQLNANAALFDIAAIVLTGEVGVAEAQRIVIPTRV